MNGTPLGTWSDGTITGASGTGLIVSAYGDVKNSEANFDNSRVTGLGSSLNSSAAGYESENQQLHLPANEAYGSQEDNYRKVYKQESWR